jgi:low affinity Fe/Cu permease
MPPEYTKEITAIVQMLMKQVLDNQDALRRSMADLERKVDVKDAVQEERIKAVQDDIGKLEDKIDEAIKTMKGVENNIITSQQEKYKSTINMQRAILGAIGLAALGYLVPLILQVIFRH